MDVAAQFRLHAPDHIEVVIERQVGIHPPLQEHLVGADGSGLAHLLDHILFGEGHASGRPIGSKKLQNEQSTLQKVV